jgi:AcrR family transcriptional regulator
MAVTSSATPTQTGGSDGASLAEGVPMKRVRARRGEGDRLREEILDAAEKLLVERADAEAVSIRAISEIVRVSAPSIYRHFVDKDALVLAVCERAYDRFGEYLNAGAAEHHGPLGEIMGRALAYVAFALDNPGQYRVLFMTPGSHTHPDFEDAHSFDIKNSRMRGLVDLVQSVESAIAAGMIKPVASPLDMSILLWSQVHGIASLRIAHPEMPWPPLEVQLETMFTMLVSGLCSEVAAAQISVQKANKRGHTATKKSKT